MRNNSDPTQPLPNPRHEAFVQALLRGEPASHAYASAGFKPNRANAARLTTNDDIRARLTFLKSLVTDQVVTETTVTVARVVEELAKLGFSNMRRYARIAQNGQAYVDLSDVSEDMWAAIQELTSETYTEGKGEDAKIVVRTKIKLHVKESPLVNLGKHLGMFDKNRAPSSPADAVPQPKAPPRERLLEMAKRYGAPQLDTIQGGKEA